MLWCWISQKTWGIETQYYSTPIGGAPGYRTSVSLRGLVLRAVPLVQTQGPRPLSPASQQGAPGPPASPFPAARVPSSALEAPAGSRSPARLQGNPGAISCLSSPPGAPGAPGTPPPAVLHSPAGGALLQVLTRPALGAQAVVPPPPSSQPGPGSSPSGPLSDGRPVIMRSGERGAPRAAALTLHISDPPGPSSIRSCSLSGRLIAGGQDGWRDRQPRNP